MTQQTKQIPLPHSSENGLGLPATVCVDHILNTVEGHSQLTLLPLQTSISSWSRALLHSPIRWGWQIFC